MNGKIKKTMKRSAAAVLSALMAVGCVETAASVVPMTADAASGTLSNAERSVIFSSTRSDFRDESIYFVMTTRFWNGDTSNDVQCWEVNPESGNYRSQYEADDPAWRGDFKGLAEKLDYIKALGFTAIWITPVVENCSGYDYHGYHAINFKKVDPRYESNDFTYQDLIDAVHAKGMKLIQDVVYNHTGNFGETNLCPMFEKEGDLSSPDCLKLASNTALPSNYFSLNPDAQYQARLALMKNTDGQNHDVNNIYHHHGTFNWDDYTCQIAQIAGDCVDLNTENPIVYNYLVDAYTNYINMGVDAFRVDTVRHISRLTLNKAFNQALLKNSEKSRDLRNGYDFFMFGEVCCRHTGGVWYRDNPGMSTPFYTWKESKDYAWSDDPANWETNYESSIQCSKDNDSNISAQPTSTNAFLNGNNYHTPDYSQFSGLSVIDFPMHWCFRDATNAFNMAIGGDQYYNDATWNVTYVDSHDYAPDNAPENQRFAGDQETWAENLSLIFSFRGIPCIYYGSEIEFQKGCLIDKGPLIKLSESGRAYYGANLEGSVVASDFTVFNASGAVAETLNHPLAQHIIRLNRLRQAIPALRKGQYSREGVSGNMAYKRRYTNGSTDSFACIVVSGSATFSGIPDGTYTDAVTGDVKTVSGGSLSISANRRGDLRVYVLNGPGRVIPDGKYLGSGSGSNIGNEDPISIVEATGVTLNATSVSVREGESTTLKATVAPANATNKTVTWTSSDESVATVGGGNVIGVSKGTATITAKTSNGKTATCKVTVTENTSIVKPTGITLDKSSLDLTAGDNGQLTATVKPADATNKTVTWTSDNTSVATVSGAGTVTAVKEGTATITASTINGYKATCTVSVQAKQVTLIDSGVYFEKPSGWNDAYIYLFDKSTDSTVGPAWPGTKMTDMGDGVYFFENKNPSPTLMIVFNGNTSPQTADLEYKDMGYYTANGLDHIVEKVQTVDVTSVSVSPSSLSLKVGETGTVTGTVSPSNATNKSVTYTSSDTSVASVTSAGVVTANSAGSAVITVKSNNGKTAKCNVTVTAQQTVSTLKNNSTVSAEAVALNQKVTLTGKASGGTSPYKYAFYYKRSITSAWTTIGTAFGTATTASFTPTSEAIYDVKVVVKDSTDATATWTYSVEAMNLGTGSALKNSSTLSATSVTLGTTVTMTGKASGGTSPYKYAYYYKKSTASSWTKAYVTSSGSVYTKYDTMTFKPTATGTYDVRINVKDEYGEGSVVSKDFTLKVISNALTNNSTISATSVTAGSTVTMTGKATGGTSPYKYGYYYKKSTDSAWTKAYVTSSGSVYTKYDTMTFKPTDAGTYNVKINVKDKYGEGTVVSKEFKLTVKPGTLVNNSKMSATTVTAGTTVTLTGKATGGTSPYKYGYYYKKSTDSAWTKAYVTSSGSVYTKYDSVTFKPTSAGTYNVRINVKDEYGEGKVVSKDLTLTVKAAALSNTSTLSSTSVKAGTTVTMTGKASGGTSPYTYSYYYKRNTSDSWTRIGDAYTSNTSASFKPTSAGTFSVRVNVKDKTGTVVARDFTLKVS